LEDEIAKRQRTKEKLAETREKLERERAKLRKAEKGEEPAHEPEERGRKSAPSSRERSRTRRRDLSEPAVEDRKRESLRREGIELELKTQFDVKLKKAAEEAAQKADELKAKLTAAKLAKERQEAESAGGSSGSGQQKKPVIPAEDLASWKSAGWQDWSEGSWDTWLKNQEEKNQDKKKKEEEEWTTVQNKRRKTDDWDTWEWSRSEEKVLGSSGSPKGKTKGKAKGKDKGEEKGKGKAKGKDSKGKATLGRKRGKAGVPCRR